MGTLIFITGPSGSGKSTLARILTKNHGVPEIISYTTRAIRAGEIPDVSYHYVSKEEFDSIDMAERVCYGGNYYGTSKEDIEKAVSSEGLTSIVVEASGVDQLMRFVGDENFIRIYMDVDKEHLYERFVKRGDTPENISKRLSMYEKDSLMKNSADIIVDNNDTLNTLYDKAALIVELIENEK